jgi:hypothetical protein
MFLKNTLAEKFVSLIFVNYKTTQMGTPSGDLPINKVCLIFVNFAQSLPASML